MPEAAPDDRGPSRGNASPASTQRVARWRERRRRGVLFVADLEVMRRDLRLLRHLGYLPADAAAAVGKDAVADAIGALLDAAARRCGLYAAGRHAEETAAATVIGGER